jgi:hypothetical protein
MTKIQSWTIAGLGTIALIVGVILAGMAITSAQEATPTPSPSTADATPAPDDGSSSDDANTGDCPGGGPFHSAVDVKAAAATVLGITEDEIEAALEDGKSLAEVAEAQGMGADDFQAALAEEITAGLDASLEAGDITQDQYDHITGELDDHLDRIINAEGGMRFGWHGRGGFGHGLMNIHEAAAEALGLSEDDLRTAMMEGQSLAEIAEAQGVSAGDLKTALAEKITAELQQKLDDGDITQDQYDDLIADLDEKLDGIINAEGGMPFGGPHRGHGHGHGFPGAPGGPWFAPSDDETDAGTGA